MRHRLRETLGLLVALLVAVPVGAQSAREVLAQVRAYRQQHAGEILQELAAWLRLPNVATNVDDIKRNAELLRGMMEKRGIRTEILPTDGGRPVVYGELEAPGAATTLLLYCHYDGQPVDATRWRTPPFEPTLRERAGNEWKTIPFPAPGEAIEDEWRLFARSVSDDKSPIVAVLAALDALRAGGREPRVNLKFLLEGEEEAGSPFLRAFVRREKQRLGADVLIIADGPVHQSGGPTLFFGARGIMTLRLVVYGPAESLHSGHYGNWAPNPGLRLARLLGTMKDSAGRVTIEGFYDDVTPLTESEKRAVAAIPPVEKELQQRYGIGEPEGGGRSLAELINLPSLNVRGLASGWVGAEARTIVPATATAEIDVRLVKGVDHERQFERIVAHIKKQGWTVFERAPTLAERAAHARVIQVVNQGGYNAVRTPMDLPLAQTMARTLARATEGEVVLLPTLGGSGPLHTFEELGLPSVGLPIVNFDNNQHSPNENLRLGHFFQGIDIFASLLWWE